MTCSTASSGFTLIELVITVAIVALLATAALPMAELVVKRGKEQELRAALREIRSAIDTYKVAVDEGKIARKAEESGYPKSLELLVEGVPNQKSEKKQKLYFLRRIPRDPLATDPALAPAQTWGKRAYASPADEPAEGEDVFDVYSRSADKGMNGVPYREW